MNPKVSVNIPVYNGGSFIKETIDSVLAQTYNNLEIIVLNDGSTDNSPEVIKKYNSKVRYYEQTNQGLARTRNRLVSLSTGKYIAFIDQDDLWLPNKIEKQVALLESDPDLALVFSDCATIAERGEILYQSSFGSRKPNPKFIFEEMLKDNCMPLPTVVMRKNIFTVIGNFVEHYDIAEEYDLFLRIAKSYKIGCHDEVLAKYRLHTNNTSRNIKKAVEETLVIHKNWRSLCCDQNPQLIDLLDDVQKTLLVKYIIFMCKNLGCLNMMKAIYKMDRLGLISSNKIKRDVFIDIIKKVVNHIGQNF